MPAEMMVDQPCWSELKCYRFQTYPDCLVVTTDADLETFKTAVDEFEKCKADGYSKNIEDILKTMGHWAVCGCDTNVVINTG